MATQKVTLTLTDSDLAKVDSITKVMDARSKAQAVSNAINLTEYLSDALKSGGDLLIRKPDGQIERIVTPWRKA